MSQWFRIRWIMGRPLYPSPLKYQAPVHTPKPHITCCALTSRRKPKRQIFSFLNSNFAIAFLLDIVSCFDSYVQKIEEAAEKGELDELVLLIIWNRLDLARRDVSILLLSFLSMTTQWPLSTSFSCLCGGFAFWASLISIRVTFTLAYSLFHELRFLVSIAKGGNCVCFKI